MAADLAASVKTLESFVFRLAYEMVAADRGTREKPFESVSAMTPAALSELEPATFAERVLEIVAKIKTQKPSPPLRSICSVCEKQAKLVHRSAAPEK